MSHIAKTVPSAMESMYLATAPDFTRSPNIYFLHISNVNQHYKINDTEKSSGGELTASRTMNLREDGGPEGIRTLGRPIKSRTLYLAELQAR